MNVNIKRTNEKIDYLILDTSDDGNINKLNALPENSSLYFFDKETNQTIKIPSQKIKQLYTENFQELSNLIQKIIDRNREIEEENILNDLKDSIFNEFGKFISSSGILIFKGVLNNIDELPINPKIGDVYEVSILKGKALCIFSPSESWVFLGYKNIPDNSHFYTKCELDDISNNLFNSLSSDANFLNNKINEINNELLEKYVLKSDFIKITNEYKEKEELYLKKIDELNERLSILLDKCGEK